MDLAERRYRVLSADALEQMTAAERAHLHTLHLNTCVKPMGAAGPPPPATPVLSVNPAPAANPGEQLALEL